MNRPIDDLLGVVGLEPMATGSGSHPTFSVIVRTEGRRPGALAEAVASIAAQTQEPLETLVMVHSSGDATDDGRAAAVAEALSGSGRPTPSNWRAVAVEGGGRSHPLNVGLDEAEGDYVTFLDDDDLVRPTWIEAFARRAAASPGAIVRAVTLTQAWTTEGGSDPVRAIGDPDRTFAAEFDLLAHFSHNETPICSVALPRSALTRFGLRFDESLPVYEDWDLLVRAAMLVGVESIPDETSLYRRLDTGSAFDREEEATWHRTHAVVVEKFASRPVLLPAGAAQRLAAAHFTPGGATLHELRADSLEVSPWWRLTSGPRRVVTALRRVRSRRGQG